MHVTRDVLIVILFFYGIPRYNLRDDLADTDFTSQPVDCLMKADPAATAAAQLNDELPRSWGNS